MSTEIKSTLAETPLVLGTVESSTAVKIRLGHAPSLWSMFTRADFLAAVETELGVRIVPADAIVIDRAELPEVTDWDGVPGGIGVGYHHYSPTYSEKFARDAVLEYLAIAEYLAAHPPVDEAQVEALVDLLLVALNEPASTVQNRPREIAEMLIATGQVMVKPS